MEKDRIKIEQHSNLGLLWIGGWLFTIGYSDLSFWKGLLAILLWPYFLGVDFAGVEGAVPAPPPAG